MHPREDNPPPGTQRGRKSQGKSSGKRKEPADHAESPSEEPADGPLCIFSRAAIRELDRLAGTEYGMPSILLMENAARGVAAMILDGLAAFPDPGALIVAGVGNNGGDGLALARHLHNSGVGVAILLVGDEGKLTPDARVNLGIVEKMKLPVVRVGSAGEVAGAWKKAERQVGQLDLVVDALLGTGVNRAVEGAAAAAIAQINAAREADILVVSVDLPSGMDADSGLPAGGTKGTCVRADLTVTLAGLKDGFLKSGAQEFLGEVAMVEIGVPVELVRRLGRTVTQEMLGATAAAG